MVQMELLISGILLTIACITLILILSLVKKEFNKSLVDINNDNDNIDNTIVDMNRTDRINSPYQFSIYKYRRLIFISLILTTMALIFYLIGAIYFGDNDWIPYFGVFVILINNLINVICIFLFDNEYDNLFKEICLHQFCQSNSNSNSNSTFNASNIIDKYIKHISGDSESQPDMTQPKPVPQRQQQVPQTQLQI